MKYITFNKFITEKSAQSGAREFKIFGNRASRSMAKLNQKCGQLTGDAKTACYYKQKDESYIAEQIGGALTAEPVEGPGPSKAKAAAEKAAAEKAAAEKAAAEKAATTKPKPEMSTLADRPAAPVKPKPEMSTLADRPAAPAATPAAPAPAAAPAAPAAAAAAVVPTFQQQEIPAHVSPKERQRLATDILQVSQKKRNYNDFGTTTPTDTQTQKRSQNITDRQNARKSNMNSVMSDPNSPAMKAAQAEIDQIANRNKSSSTYRGNRGGAQDGINDKTADQIRRRHARQANSVSGGVAAGGGGGAGGGGAGGGGAGANPWRTATGTDWVGNPTDDKGYIPQPIKQDNINRPVDPRKPTETIDNLWSGVGAIASGDVNRMGDVGNDLTAAFRNPGGTNYFGIPLPDRLRHGIDRRSGEWGYDSKGVIGGMFGADNSPEDEATMRDIKYLTPDQLRQRDPNAPRVDPNAGPNVQASTITKDQVDKSGDLRRSLGIQGAGGQNADNPDAIDRSRNDAGAGSAAINPGENTTSARARISTELQKQGKTSEEIVAELKKLKLLSASFGAATAVGNLQRTDGNTPRTVDQSRGGAPGPVVPFQQS